MLRLLCLLFLFSFSSISTIKAALPIDQKTFILPSYHVLRPTLDAIFSRKEVLKNEKTFTKAGFHILCRKSSSGILLATHPLVKDYLFKLYLDSDTYHRGMLDHWTKQDCLIQRCIGAAKIRALIHKMHMIHFTVPDKWIYPVKDTYVLVETFMDLCSRKESQKAWKTKITKKHLDELFVIMKNGCASGGLSLNVPYTKSGKFAFIDTEYPERVFDLSQEKKYFSKEMQNYWDFLISRSTS